MIAAMDAQLAAVPQLVGKDLEIACRASLPCDGARGGPDSPGAGR